MLNRVMITGVSATDYLSGFFRENEALLAAEEKAQATVKGWAFLGVEGGSDTIYTYRIPASIAPQDFGEWAFRAVEVECTGASGRTWSNGQKGPMEADVTFQAVAVKPLELTVIQADAKRRAEQAKMETDAFKQQRVALTALEAKVRERLSKGVADTSKSSK